MNLDTDAACAIGDRTYIRQPEPQMREISGTVEFSDASTTSGTSIPGYDMLLTTGGKLYNGDTADPAIKLTLTNGTQHLVIGIRKVRWEAPTANISGRDTQTLSLNFVALVDAAGTGAGASLMSTICSNFRWCIQAALADCVRVRYSLRWFRCRYKIQPS